VSKESHFKYKYIYKLKVSEWKMVMLWSEGVSSQTLMLSITLKDDSIRRLAFGRGRSSGRALMNGTRALIKEAPERSRSHDHKSVT